MIVLLVTCTYLFTFLVFGQAKSEACVAGLLGGRKVAECLAMTQRKFRSISARNVQQQDFSSSEEPEGNENTMFSRSSPAMLGHCDAFISHSWSDPANKKYEVLENWSEEFRNTNSRDPQLWLDKACLDQREISEVSPTLQKGKTVPV